MSATQLDREINDVLDALAAREEEWVPRWVANRIVSDHDPEIGSSFVRHCTYRHVRERVAAIVRRRTDPERRESSEQLSMPGYDHLQFYYTVDRDGERRSLPTSRCSDDELLAKAAEMRTTARSLEAHAQEIERYLGERGDGGRMAG